MNSALLIAQEGIYSYFLADFNRKHVSILVIEKRDEGHVEMEHTSVAKHGRPKRHSLIAGTSSFVFLVFEELF